MVVLVAPPAQHHEVREHLIAEPLINAVVNLQVVNLQPVGALAELAPVARLNESAVALYFHSLVFSAPARSALRRYPPRRPYASSSSVYPFCTLLIRTCYFMGVAWYANREDKGCFLLPSRPEKVF